MALYSLAAVMALISPNFGAVSLSHVFAKGEKLQYEVKSSIQIQERQRGLETWIPWDLDMHYKFNLEVLDLKTDGIAQIRYLRPTFTTVEGETVESPPKTNVDKVNNNFVLTVSPINEILGKKDETKKPKKPADGDGGLPFKSMSGIAGKQLPPFFGQFIGEVHGLALFLGDVDSSLDFAPRLPFEQINPGATWKRTIAYSPQKTKSTNGKTVVQRLDYTYTYKGIVESEGKKVYRVTADLNLDTSLADFVHETFDLKPEDTGLKAFPLKLKASIEFDLDMATKRTLRADATSEGGFKVIITAFPDEAYVEETFKGHTTLRLLAIAPAK